MQDYSVKDGGIELRKQIWDGVDYYIDKNVEIIISKLQE